MLCGNGECGTACELAADAPSNVGCEFWAVDLDNIDYLGNDPASAPWGVVLSNAGESQADVTIEINNAPAGQPAALAVVQQITVAANALEQVVLPTRELDCGVVPNDYASPGTCLSSNAYRITSSMPIVVYQFNTFANTGTGDASLLLPTSALGRWHRIISWPPNHATLTFWPTTNEPLLDRSYVTIVGTTADTQVKVRPSARLKGNAPIPGTDAGGEVVVTLGPFDVLNLETDEQGDQEPGFVDLSGTVVESDKPVAVFSGVEQANSGSHVDVDLPEPPDGAGACCNDHLEDQILPVESVGTKYVIARSPVRSIGPWKEPDILRFVGVAETAHVMTSLPAPYAEFTLEPGQVVTTWTQEDISVSSDTPLLVGQILVGNGWVDGQGIGDPSLTVFAPVSQQRDDYVILAPASWDQTWVVISNAVGTSPLLDGSSTDACLKEGPVELDGVAYESRHCPLTEGVHKLTGDQPFGIVTYGYGAAGSYALVGGSNFAKTYDPPAIE